jgi:hypothetical protein
MLVFIKASVVCDIHLESVKDCATTDTILAKIPAAVVMCFRMLNPVIIRALCTDVTGFT